MDHRQPHISQPQQAKDPTLPAAPAAATDPPLVASAVSISDLVAANPLLATAAAASAYLGAPPVYPPLTGSPNALLNEAPLQLSPQEEHPAVALGRIRRGPSSSIAARATALALYSEGVKSKDIEVKCGIKRVAFIKLLGRARKRGFVPGKPVLMEHVVDAPRSGRPKKTPVE